MLFMQTKDLLDEMAVHACRTVADNEKYGREGRSFHSRPLTELHPLGESMGPLIVWL